MNEQIKLLAEKCNISTLVDSWEYEQFAELIVQECVEQLITGVRTNPPQEEPPELVQTLVRRIQQHFGVEE